MSHPFTDQFDTLKLPNLGLVRFPKVDLSAADRATYSIKGNADNRAILKQIVWAGYLALRAKGKLKDVSEQEAKERLRVEFATFEKTAVFDYLLLVWDICRWADQQGIVRGFGRGSAGGSLTNYCLGIVKVNPLKHKLDFPRFISEARMKPVVKDGITYVDGKAAPDIDLDFEYGRRVEVLRYVDEKYPGRTCKISTRLELTGKTALKNVLKIYASYRDEEAQRVSDLIEVKFGKVQSLHEAREKNEGIKTWIAASDVNKRIYGIAMAIEGLAVARGQHPSGVFIGHHTLDGVIPTEMAKEPGGGWTLTSSYDMETMAGLGTKCDFLGLRTLDIVAGTAKLVNISLDDIDIEDPVIYDYISTKDTYVGLFQIAEGTTKDVARKVGPRNVEDLAAVLAISRPGALAYVDQLVAYVKKGEIKPFYPPIDDILKRTGGALIMQEQITAICRDVFGMSGVDADSVRAACGKKKREEMAKWESVIRNNGAARGIPKAVIDTFWATCNASADYSFNEIHAYEYSYLTAVTAFEKARYPLQFYLMLLRLAKEEPNPTEYMNTIIGEMRRVGVSLLPPDIMRSDMDFSIDGTSIRFGLASIKGISDMTFAKLGALRGRTFPTKWELFDAARGAAIQINMLTGLIYSGTLGWSTTSRARLALEAQTYNLLSDGQKTKVKGWAAKTGMEDIIEILKALVEAKNEKGKSLLATDQYERIKRDYADYWRAYEANCINESLTLYIAERHFLGFSYSASLYSVYSPKVADLLTLDSVKAKATQLAALPPPKEGEKPPRQEPMKVVGFVEEMKEGLSKANGTPYYRGVISDDTASYHIMVYGEENCEACRSFNGKVPEEGDIVIATVTFSRDYRMLFASSLIVQNVPVCLSKRDAKEAAPVL